jgi:hypothetical protein
MSGSVTFRAFFRAANIFKLSAFLRMREYPTWNIGLQAGCSDQAWWCPIQQATADSILQIAQVSTLRAVIPELPTMKEFLHMQYHVLATSLLTLEKSARGCQI